MDSAVARAWRHYRTVYFELTLLKSVNAWLIEQNVLSAEGRIHYSLTKAMGTDTYCYTRAEVAAMIAHCRANPELHWLTDVVVALAHLGVRIGELAGLRWKDVDLEANVIVVADERTSRRKHMIGTVRTTKGKRSRTIPIHPRLRELLVGLSRQTDGWVSGPAGRRASDGANHVCRPGRRGAAACGKLGIALLKKPNGDGNQTRPWVGIHDSAAGDKRRCRRGSQTSLRRGFDP